MYFTIGFKNKFLYQKEREREIRWENRCCRKHWGGIVGEVERISSKLCIIDSKVRKDFKNECQVNNEQHCWDKLKPNSPDCILSKVWWEHVSAIVGKAENTF